MAEAGAPAERRPAELKTDDEDLLQAAKEGDDEGKTKCQCEAGYHGAYCNSTCKFASSNS
jgi:hypothetical protein